MLILPPSGNVASTETPRFLSRDRNVPGSLIWKGASVRKRVNPNIKRLSRAFRDPGCDRIGEENLF